ncbi:MAG TPA: pyridoxamine 5'-phosphate oxidase family protein [Moheibacter sp.]|nr:pyridoxamine 5'-phosphate oxidase family protein [Moheibacter sp.]
MSKENLHQEEALEKLQDLINKIDIGMLCTHPEGHSQIHVVPMSRQEVDDQGNIWYLFSAESETYKNLQTNKKLSVLFSHVGDYEILSINGTAEVSSDQARIDKYWNKFVASWFQKGKEDPNIRILKVKVDDAHYWDTKSNKFITLIKLATSAVSGQKLDLGREGELNL